jgi:4-amino-4-deoxy-L-arabinose transferase-like glycosyltransferase
MDSVALVSLLLIFLGSALLSLQRYLWDAGLLLVLGLVGMVFSLGRAFFMPSGSQKKRAISFDSVSSRAWIRLGSVLLAAFVGIAARGRGLHADFTGLLLLWLLAMVGFCATFVPSFATVRRKLALSRRTWLALGGLLLAALLLRVGALGRIPANLGGDEGTQALLGLQLLEGGLGNPFATGWYSVPNLSFLLYGFTMRVAGATIAGARFLSALAGALTVLTTWGLGRALGGRRVGWVAAIVVAVSAYHVHFSRLASNQIFDPLIATAVFWALAPVVRGQREGAAVWRWAVAGMVSGFGWYLYFGARWVTVMVALVVLWRALVEPRFLQRHLRGLALFAAGWLVVALPLLFWYLAHPADLTARYNAVSIFASGWLEREVELTGKSALTLLLQQLWKAVSAFHLTPDPTFWYRPERPLLDPVLGALMLVGMIAAVLRWRWPSRGLTLLWFWSTLIMAWGVTENPPSSQRGVLLIPVVALLCAWGSEALVDLWSQHQRWVRGGVVALLALAVVLNVGFYFAIYTPRRIYGNPTAEVATEVARFIQSNPHLGEVYFFGPPHLYWDFGTLAFLLRDQPGRDVPPGEIPEGVTRPARFVLVFDRTAALDEVQQRYPAGEVSLIQGQNRQLLALVYDW